MSGLVAGLRRHFRTRTRGQSFVEFALILPVFLLFLAATLDLGRVFYANITLNNAAREGAFQAAKTPELFDAGQPCDQATNRVVCRVQNETVGSMIAIQPDDIDMTCNPGTCPEAAGATVTVRVRGEFRLITPILSFVFGGQTLQLASAATAQIEYLPNINLITPPPGPTARFIATSPTSILPGGSVSFDSSASLGDPTGFQWDFDGDAFVDSTEANPTWTYPNVTVTTKYTVTLTVINMTNSDVEVKVGYVTVTPDGSDPDPSESESAQPLPTCVHPPNVVGKTLTDAQALLQQAGFLNTVTIVTSGPKNKVQGQNPDQTECKPLGTTIELVYRGTT
ncbi:MAG TPA: TadE/TadG family type IV pilus assembly protein [Candidatus Limnocylindrales bacterium]|nr:TadE/TadG family type IV pilus assembly protein [Candidatus Limnocylindrales bacterium]